MKTRFRRPLAGVASTAAMAPALAHDGHGLFGGHWHATDAWGFVTAAVAVLLALWLSHGNK